MAGTLAELMGVWALCARPLERADVDRWERVELTVLVFTTVAMVGSWGDISYHNSVGGHVEASVYIYTHTAGRDNRQSYESYMFLKV